MHVALALVSLLACRGTGPSDTAGLSDTATFVELQDVGTACIADPDLNLMSFWDVEDRTSPLPPVDLSADAAATVYVILRSCVSSSIRDPMVSCTVEADGNTLKISAEGSYGTPTGSWMTDCTVFGATCTTPPLPAGITTLTYGEGSVSLDLPYSDEIPCISAK